MVTQLLNKNKISDVSNDYFVNVVKNIKNNLKFKGYD